MNVLRSTSGEKSQLSVRSSRTTSRPPQKRTHPTRLVSKEFSRKEDYEITLERLAKDFLTKWDEHKPSPEVGLSGYDEIAVLGAGSFGRVKLVKDHITDHYYAVKILLKDHVVKTKQVSHIYNEKRVLHSVKFPFLVALEFSSKDNDCLYFGLPFINGGELFTYHRKVRKFNEKQARFYGTQVFLALEYLHHMKLLYRDLKPENIMVCSNGYIKVTDFGFTKKVETRTMTLCGTPEYLAPEIIQSKPYGTSVDWWAFGILLYEFVAGNSPFSQFNKDVMVMYSKICEGEYRCPSFFSVPLKDLIRSLLQTDLTRRMGSLITGSRDIKEHEWFKSVDWHAILNQEVSAPYVPVILNMEDLSHFEKWPEQKYTKSKTNKYPDIFQDF